MPSSSQNAKPKIAATRLPRGPRLGGGTGRRSATGVPRQRVGPHPPRVGGAGVFACPRAMAHVARHRRVGGGAGQGEAHLPELAALQQTERLPQGAQGHPVGGDRRRRVDDIDAVLVGRGEIHVQGGVGGVYNNNLFIR